MATKTEIKKFLKEQNLTEKEVTDLFNDLASTNSKVATLIRSGVKWQNMNLYVLRNIKIQKQLDLEQKEKKELEKLEAEEKKKQKELDDAYYYANFKELMVKKVDSQEELTEDEVRSLVFGYCEDNFQEDGEARRWSSTITSYFSYGCRWFAIEWESGLTECQENDFSNQPYEVKRVQKVIIRTVTEWEKV